jgi:hypothetical protein
MKRDRITVELPAEWIALLRVLGDPADVLAELADHAQQGVCRPGSWERGWVRQAFGGRFTDKLEQVPEVPWRQRPRRANKP